MNFPFKKYLKNFELTYKVRNLISDNHIKKYGKKNFIKVGKRVQMKQCAIKIYGNNNVVSIGNEASLCGMSIFITGDNSYIEIGDGTTINAYKAKRTAINAVNGTKITIGKRCLLSNDIEIHTSDYHSIFDQNGERINHEKDICIGDHVWVGLRSLILKGTIIEDDCIIGASTLLSGIYNEKNALIVGIPGKVIKHNMNWDMKI